MNQITFMRLLASLTLVCLFCIQASAKEKVQISPQPGWLYTSKADLTRVPPARSISNGYYFELIDEQMNLITGTEYTHYIKQIINESGIQHESEVSVTFAPQFQELTIHMITIFREGLVINQLTPGVIKVVQEETDAADFQYNGLKRAFITLKDVRKNDRIEVSYSLTGQNPVFENKYSDESYFTNETAVCNYFKTIITTPDRRLIIRTTNGAPMPEEQQGGGNYIYHWDNPPVKTWESSANTPSWYIPVPGVVITEYKSWQEVVEWGLQIFRNYQYPIPASLQTRIAAWKKAAAGNQDDFANMATHFVQDEVRYLGLEIGPNTHQPRPPADVYTHRFGDCKDKALLLATILREDGIQAYVALISTTSRNKLSTALPSPGAFDHAIVAVSRSANVFLFIDPTISSQRGELLNRYVPAYGYSLVLRQGDSHLWPVDAPFLYNYNIVETLDVKNYDSSRFTVTSTYAGGAADHVRSNFAEYSMKELEESYRKAYADIYNDIQLDGPITSSDDSMKNELTVKESYVIPEIWSTSDKGRRSVPFGAKVLNDYIPAIPSRTGNAPIALSFPRTINYTANIIMPEEWGFDMEELHIKNDAFQFDFTPAVSLNHITLHFYYKTFKDNIPAELIEKYRTDYRNIMERVSFELYENTTPSSSKPSGKDSSPFSSLTTPGVVYWPAVWFTLVIAILITALFRHLNSYTEYLPHNPHYQQSRPLSGWTIVLGVGICLGLVAQIFTFVREYYYSSARWSFIEDTGGAPLRYYYFTDLATALIHVTGLAAIIFWYLKKRDIFPRMFTWYVGILLSGQLLLIILYALIPLHTDKSQTINALIMQFLRTGVYATIWVTYVRRSTNVRNTFIERF